MRVRASGSSLDRDALVEQRQRTVRGASPACDQAARPRAPAQALGGDRIPVSSRLDRQGAAGSSARSWRPRLARARARSPCRSRPRRRDGARRGSRPPGAPGASRRDRRGWSRADRGPRARRDRAVEVGLAEEAPVGRVGEIVRIGELAGVDDLEPPARGRSPARARSPPAAPRAIRRGSSLARSPSRRAAAIPRASCCRPRRSPRPRPRRSCSTASSRGLAQGLVTSPLRSQGVGLGGAGARAGRVAARPRT